MLYSSSTDQRLGLIALMLNTPAVLSDAPSPHQAFKTSPSLPPLPFPLSPLAPIRHPAAAMSTQPAAGGTAALTTSSRKLVLLGESAVGKSSLVLQFVKKEFADYRESTIGMLFLFVSLSLALVSPFTWCANWAHECVAW